MSESIHTMEELKQWQALPLSIKVKMTKARIRDWVNAFGEDGVYVSFSGGKDSTVLLHIIREEYPNVPAVFFDTGLEFPEIRQHVKKFDNVQIEQPAMTFKRVLWTYGYPMFSKEISKSIYAAKRYLIELEKHKEEGRSGPVRGFYEFCRITGAMGGVTGGHGNEIFEQIKAGTLPDEILDAIKDRDNRYIPEVGRGSKLNLDHYQFMLSSPFQVSSRCCDIMKKACAHRYQEKTGRLPMTAQLACESDIRANQWMKNGCNGFALKNPISNPMAFWTEQDILHYIKENNIEIASVYGDVVSDDEIPGQMNIFEWLGEEDTTRLYCTGCERTGCIFCLYGYHLEKRHPNRLEVLPQVSRPELLDFMLRGGAFDQDGLWKPDKRGLGFWFPMQWCNVHGGMNMYIPNYEHYEQEYGTEQTAKHLEVV